MLFYNSFQNQVLRKDTLHGPPGLSVDQFASVNNYCGSVPFICLFIVLRSHVHVCTMAWVVHTGGGQPFTDSVPPSLICYLLKSVSS